MSDNELSKYAPVNDRLKEIIEQVSDESIGLDAALDLFEEAVRLGVRASTLLEEDIVSHDAPAGEAGEADEAQPQGAAVPAGE